MTSQRDTARARERLIVEWLARGHRARAMALRNLDGTGSIIEDLRAILAENERLRGALRPEVQAFAQIMEATLKANDHKGGWKHEPVWTLLNRLREETAELEEAVRYAQRYDTSDRGARSDPWARIGREAADVANFALMVADVCGALSNQQRSGE